MGEVATEVEIFGKDTHSLWELVNNQCEGLQWNTSSVELNPESVGSMLIPDGFYYPHVSVSVFPARGELLSHSPSFVPLVTGHISRYESHPLRKYLVRKENRDKNLARAHSVDEAVSMMIESAGIKAEFAPDTPVMDVVAFLPLREGCYETNFSPCFKSPRGLWGYPTIVQDRLVGRVLAGRESELLSITDDEDGKSKAPYFRADSIASYSGIERLNLPDNKGTMVVVALPLKKKEKPPQLFFGGGYNSRSFGFGDLTRGATRSAHADDVDISTGADSGTDYGKIGVVNDPTGKPIIYHFRVIGVTQEAVPSLNLEIVRGLCEGMKK